MYSRNFQSYRRDINRQCDNAKTEVCTICYGHTGETFYQCDAVPLVIFQLLPKMLIYFDDAILSKKENLYHIPIFILNLKKSRCEYIDRKCSMRHQEGKTDTNTYPIWQGPPAHSTNKFICIIFFSVFIQNTFDRIKLKS